MLNPNEINPKHIHSLQATLMKYRSKLDERKITNLYKAAKTLFFQSNPSASLLQDQTMWRSRIANNAVVISTCTDVETGLFIQLAGDPNSHEDALLLTFGQKYCVEWKDAMRNNVATKIW
jgi:hypothetical protein